MTWTPLHAQIHRTIRARNLFERNQKLLVAVSGGQDSLCLIKLLLEFLLGRSIKTNTGSFD